MYYIKINISYMFKKCACVLVKKICNIYIYIVQFQDSKDTLPLWILTVAEKANMSGRPHGP